MGTWGLNCRSVGELVGWVSIVDLGVHLGSSGGQFGKFDGGALWVFYCVRGAFGDLYEILEKQLKLDYN